MNRQQRVLTLFALLLMSAAMFGCANSSRVDDDRGDATAYESDLARARTSIEEAERAGAAEFGLAELASARDKVRAAELAAEDDEDQRARQLAVEASARRRARNRNHPQSQGARAPDRSQVRLADTRQ